MSAGTYRTIAERSGRGIEGFSQGGRGTVRYMFNHPELFCSAAPGGEPWPVPPRPRPLSFTGCHIDMSPLRAEGWWFRVGPGR